MRHDVELAGNRFSFYSLLAHLAPQPISSESQIPWIRDLLQSGNRPALSALVKGGTALIDIPVEAGDVVGTVGWVRRGPEWGPEVHFETFMVERPPEVLSRTFRYMAAAADGLVIARGSMIGYVDENADRHITLEELRRFYREGDPAQRWALRHIAIRHVHEWGDRLADPALAAGPLRGRAAQEEVRRVRARTTAPYVFWDARLSAHAGPPGEPDDHLLPPDRLPGGARRGRKGIDLHWPPAPPWAPTTPSRRRRRSRTG
jgi:hypothetical protein